MGALPLGIEQAPQALLTRTRAQRADLSPTLLYPPLAALFCVRGCHSTLSTLSVRRSPSPYPTLSSRGNPLQTDTWQDPMRPLSSPAARFAASLLPKNGGRPQLMQHRGEGAPRCTLSSGADVSTPAHDVSSAPGPLDGYMARVGECNQGLEKRAQFLPFVLDKEVVGFVHKEFWEVLSAFPSVFTPTTFPPNPAAHHQTGPPLPGTAVTLAPPLQGAPLEERTAAVGEVLVHLRDARGLVPGWRDEFYPVGPSFGCPPSLLVERAAAPFFGVKAYGVHLNGYTKKASRESDSDPCPDPETFLWVAKRSATKPTYPGKLDNMVAGGQPYNLSCRENVLKECAEEAGVAPGLARRAVPVGAVSYENVNGWSLKRDVLFTFDLQLPPSFTPQCTDGEVDEFQLLPIAEAARLVRETTGFKNNCNLVIIDFLMRHGFITPDEPGYLRLLHSLRKGELS